MNLKPKIRPAWQRALIMVALSWLAVWKFLHLPTFFFPRSVRGIARYWTYEMFWMAISSRVTKVYIDQTCYYKRPASIKPKATDVDPRYRLSEEELRSFHDNGFLGPYDCFTPEQMKRFRQRLLEVKETNSLTYGWNTPRDRHFEMPDLLGMFKHPAIVDRCAQLLGPNLNCWRSQIFYKMAGAPRIQWHHASTFMCEDYLDPAIFPADRDSLFQLTVWVAVDEATLENGCLEFLPGSMDSMKPIKFGGQEGFYEANFTLDYDCDQRRAVALPCKPGQFILFTERCVHGSPPNNSTRDRIAFNLRVTPTEVPAYSNGKKYYRSVYNGGKYYLDNWGVVCIRGQDHLRLSKVWDPKLHLPKQAPTLGQQKAA